MAEPAARAITDLLQRWKSGDEAALDQLTPLVYPTLRDMARRYLARERPGHTLQSTGLVHEAFLRLVQQRDVEWQSRAHFFALAARLMRRILVDHARQAGRAKRGAGAPKIPLDDALPIANAPGADPVDLLDLDDALRRLEALDARQARLVELRFFGGLSVEETAEVLDVSPATVKRQWGLARAWLYRWIAAAETDGPEAT